MLPRFSDLITDQLLFQLFIINFIPDRHHSNSKYRIIGLQ